MDIKGKFTKLNFDSTMDPVTTLSNIQTGSETVRFSAKTERYLQSRRSQNDAFLTNTVQHKRLASLTPIPQLYHIDFNYLTKAQIDEEFNQRQKIMQRQKVVQQLTDEKDMVIIDKEIIEKKWVQGIIAEQLFPSHYKKINKILDQNQQSETPDSHLTNLFLALDKNRLLPSKLGIVKKPKSPNSVPLNHFKYGDKYIDALSHGQNLLPQLSTFLLRNNRISEKSAVNLLNNLNNNLIQLDLSFNKIGIEGCKILCNYLKKPEIQLEKLQLKQNDLLDNDIKEILPGLMFNKTLKILDISRNKITDDIFENFVIFIEKSTKLQELYLGWNIIGSKGGNKLFQSIETNKYLKVLDISWNNLSGDITSICNFLRSNTILIHLDLSNNKFTYSESKAISEALESNQTIYGFHFKGNYGIVDTQGFLVVDKKERNNENISYDAINGVMYQNLKKNLNAKDICWICDNWRQASFEWIPQVSDKYEESEKDILFLHPEFENYQGIYYGEKNEKGTYFMELMVPHYKFHYFYSLNWQQEAAKDQSIYKINQQLTGIYSQLKDETCKINALNYLNQEQFDPIFNSNYQCQISILPRTRRLQYEPAEDEQEKKIWRFKDSIFADYKIDNDAKFKRCFEFDVQHTKIEALIKDPDDLNLTKLYIQKHYRELRNIYRHYSCISPVGQIWAITIGPFTQFIKDLNILDHYCKEEDINIKWTSVTSGAPINQRSPSRGIVRHQFIELLVRLVEFKYVKSKQFDTFHESFQLFFEKHFLPLAVGKNPQEFREKVLWTEQADKVIKSYMEPLKQIYKNNAKMNVLPGQKPFMCVDELNRITKEIGIPEIDVNFGEKAVFQAFCLSQNCVVDEIMNNLVFELDFNEFLEALGRLAYEIQPQVFEFNSNLLSDPQYQEHYQAIKLESLIQLMQILYQKKKATDYTFKDTSVFLKKDGQYLFGFYD